jgi:hypothetical protein
MIAHRAQLLAFLLLAGFACQDEPTQTHIVLEVHVAKAIEAEVTSIVVHGEKPSSSGPTDVSKATADFEPGDTPRFVLQPATGQAQLQVRVVAMHERDELASALVKSRYAAGRGLHLDVELGCTGPYDLGEQEAAATPSKKLVSCDYEKLPSGGSGGKAGSGGGPAAGTSGKIVGAVTAAGGGGSSGTGEAGLGADEGGAGAAGLGSSGTAAGSGGAGSGGAGAGGAGAGGAGAGGAGAGGAGAGGAGAGGAGAGGAGAGGRSGAGAGGDPFDCVTWTHVTTISDAIESLNPPAYIAGHELRDNPTEEIPQFICQATPPGLSTKLVGKASRWGCYIPGPGTTAYTVTEDVEIMVSSNTSPCLRWNPLSPTIAPASRLMFGDDGSRVCRVSHSGNAEGRSTSGERVGQVRLESNQYVCRFEFYYYLDNMTHVNLAGEATQVLDLAP